MAINANEGRGGQGKAPMPRKGAVANIDRRRH
jgi:hypothetical protein